jgi:bifunctional non-homologous end joining protein LigD
MYPRCLSPEHFCFSPVGWACWGWAAFAEDEGPWRSALKGRKVEPLIDGEVVCCGENGLAAFQLLRLRRNEPQAFLYAFDLLELDGTDLRREPIEVRKSTLASILRKSRPGVRLNEHLEHDCGLTVFQHACKMGLEGIVSKRLGSRYRSGRSPDWLKFKNPEAPAVRREAEEDWRRGPR